MIKACAPHRANKIKKESEDEAESDDGNEERDGGEKELARRVTAILEQIRRGKHLKK